MRLGPDLKSRLCAAAAALAVLAGAATAQTAGQITEESFQPPGQRMTGSLVFSGEPGLAPPPGADRLSIQLQDVVVSDPLSGTGDLVAALRARLTGERIAVSTIFTEAGAFEQALAQRGYVLARVVIPAQTLVDGGTLHLQVIDGFIEAIDAAEVPEPLRRRLAELTDPLVGTRQLTRRQLERRLLLAGDTYGLALDSALAAGNAPGGTVIVLDPNYRRITGFVSLDNSFSKELGRTNLSAGVELNGLLGLGEVLYGRLSGHPELGDRGWFSDRPRLRTLALGMVVPLGGDGLTFNIEAAQSRTRPEGDAADTASEFERFSLRLYYPWLRSSSANLSFQLSLDAQRDREDLLTGAGPIGIYEDVTRVLRLEVSGSRLTRGGAFSGSATYSMGLDGLGARSAADAAASAVPLSRDGADADFRKLEVVARYGTTLGEVWDLSLAGRAQTSFGQPMLSAEQFGIASFQDLSPFAQGGISGDSGWVVRGELAHRSYTQLGGQPLMISPYVFGAAGEVFIERPTAAEAPRIGATAYGLGVDLSLTRDPKFSSASLRIEYGKGNRDDDGEDPQRLGIFGSFRF